MDRITLGRSDLKVSRLCLGSMGWGTRNTEAEGHAQIDRALDGGINFIDTAEMYPTYPARAETAGRTEEIIGTWVAKTGRRGDVVLASKISGKGGVARGGAAIDSTEIARALDGSLARLQTDCIDLYQTHWANRGSYHMRQNWTYDPPVVPRDALVAHMVDVMEAMQSAIKAGKIRAWGLSNETAWGTGMWLRVAEENGLPGPVSIQNEYSLLCRHADLDLAEMCVNEDVPLLPFSPLAMGLISGKYGPDVTPPQTRRQAEATLNRRITPRVWPAVAAYRDIAARHGLEANQMALAFTLTRPFVASPIFGASTPEQLDLAIGAADLTLSDTVLNEIGEAHKAQPMPF